MNIRLLNEHNFKFLSIKECYTGSPESIHVKMPHRLKSHVAAQLYSLKLLSLQLSCSCELRMNKVQ